MQAAAGVIKVVASPARCPAIDADTGRCSSVATTLARITTNFGDTYIRACAFHADKMENE